MHIQSISCLCLHEISRGCQQGWPHVDPGVAQSSGAVGAARPDHNCSILMDHGMNPCSQGHVFTMSVQIASIGWVLRSLSSDAGHPWTDFERQLKKKIWNAKKSFPAKNIHFGRSRLSLSLTAGRRILCRQSLCHGREAGGPVGLPDENVNRDGPALLQCHQRWFRHVVCGTATRAEGASGSVRSDRCKW